MRPVIRQSSAEKIFRYFFGEEWKKYPAVELAIRNENNKINFFDDELIVFNKRQDRFKTFNWNADPSRYRIGNEGTSILRTGVHFFTISYHHKWNDAKRYVALRPATPGELLPVHRMDAKNRLIPSSGTAINQHAGGDRTTGSRGCQTAPRVQYGEFITFIGDAFDVKIPLGVQKKAEKKFMSGIGKIPYILVTQEQFNYIVALDEADFDSAADLEYQRKNFVNVPKVESIQPVLALADNAAEIIAELEAENENPIVFTFDEDPATVPANNPAVNNLNDSPSNISGVEPETNAFDSPAAVETGKSEPSPVIFNSNSLDNLGEKIGGFLEDQKEKVEGVLGRTAETVTETLETQSGKIEKTVSEVKDVFEPLSIPAFIPRFGKQWLLSLIPAGGFVSTIVAYVQNAPQWLVFLLGAITGIALWNFFTLVIRHREKVLDFVTRCYETTADPTRHNLIPTNAAKEVGGSIFGWALNGSRRETLERALGAPQIDS